jgi:hypothetical protein
MPIVRYAVALLWLAAPACAHANCARDVQDMTQKVKQISDKQKRLRAQDYLKRAHRELSENDEFECQSAISEINKLLDAKPAK